MDSETGNGTEREHLGHATINGGVSGREPILVMPNPQSV